MLEVVRLEDLKLHYISIVLICRWIQTQIKILKRKRRRRAKQRKSKSIVITASQEEDGDVMEEDDEGKFLFLE